MPRKKSSRRRKKRGSGNNYKKIVLVFFGFFFILFGAIYYMDHLRDSQKSGNLVGREGVKDTDSEISEIDRSISETLFDLGVTGNEIKESYEITKKDRGRTWVYKEKTIFAEGESLGSDIFKTKLQRIASPPDSRSDIRKTEDGYILDIRVNDLLTHRLKFRSVSTGNKKAVARRSVRPPGHKKSVTDKERDKVKEELFSQKLPKVVIIVDDLGMDRLSVDRFAEISTGLTLAVLPNLPHSLYAAKVAKEKNMDLLLHLPMEPKTISGYNAEDAGEGVLLVGQTKENIVKSLEQNINSLPDIVGVNNHMGSKFTENDELMELILRKLQNRGLFFVDSLTTPDSSGYPIAKRIGMKAAKRDYFLDDKKKGKDYVVKQLSKLVEKSEREGIAIGICHPYPQTIEALEQELPKLGKRVQIVPASEVIN